MYYRVASVKEYASARQQRCVCAVLTVEQLLCGRGSGAVVADSEVDSSWLVEGDPGDVDVASCLVEDRRQYGGSATRAAAGCVSKGAVVDAADQFAANAVVDVGGRLGREQVAGVEEGLEEGDGGRGVVGDSQEDGVVGVVVGGAGAVIVPPLRGSRASGVAGLAGPVEHCRRVG